MLFKFNSGHDQEAKNLYLLVRVPRPRLLRFLESGEITSLFPFRKAGHTNPIPFPVRVNCSVTIEATQSLRLGTVSDNFQLSVVISFVVVFTATIVVLFFSRFFPNWPFQSFLRNVTSQFEFLKIKISRIFWPSRFV